MATIDDLTATLADALGLPRKMADGTARALREAGMLPDSGAQASIEHAAVLLIALMAPQSSRSAPDSIDLYAGLLFERITRNELMPDGRFEIVTVADDDPFVENMRGLVDNFGEFLRSYIIAFNETPKMDSTPGEIIIGGGAGNPFAAMQFHVLADGVNVGGSIRFSLAPVGGGRHPDDAPVARLDSYTRVPGSIFQVLRNLFTGDTEGPRKEIIPRASPVVGEGQRAMR